MTNLCIIIRSIYPVDVGLEHNAEAIEDSTTVRETLTDHDIVEIDIPIEFERFCINQKIGTIFAPISPQEYQYCHIVINTHGARGRADMMDGAVQEVILHLSHRNTSVTQISALLCSGMRQRVSIGQQREGYLESPTRPSSMQLLQAKLNHTSTPIHQSFHIYGFYSAYDPITDKDKVIEVLQGVGRGLVVTTRVQSRKTIEEYVAEIKNNMVIIRLGEKSTEAYTRATNVLGEVFGEMKENIHAFLEEREGLAPQNRDLYDRLNNVVRLTPTNFHRVWGEWFKQHKIGSEERLAMLNSYCQVLSPSLQEEDIDNTVHATVSFPRLRFIGQDVKGSAAADTNPHRLPYQTLASRA